MADSKRRNEEHRRSKAHLPNATRPRKPRRTTRGTGGCRGSDEEEGAGEAGEGAGEAGEGAREGGGEEGREGRRGLGGGVEGGDGEDDDGGGEEGEEEEEDHVQEFDCDQRGEVVRGVERLRAAEDGAGEEGVSQDAQ
ncbi:hypothetical protein Syun_013817 [Stephania yunnanensis]|uniref:Uncharacterized protein n=1 Tax=Stephania yunnanensis TaxID=152371 RepID=A0AAP0JIB3_9MAGN